jgi:alpha-tubulin suppressor-like RCC1 family protein
LLDCYGDLYVWGAGEVGQLGTSNRINECKPQLIRKQQFLRQGEEIKEIALGYFHTLILTNHGRVLHTGQQTPSSI